MGTTNVRVIYIHLMSKCMRECLDTFLYTLGNALAILASF